jgi:hypothetical protein
MNLREYKRLTNPICSDCGGPCYWHGLEGHWVFQCYCQGRNGAEIVEKHVKDKDWDREDD